MFAYPESSITPEAGCRRKEEGKEEKQKRMEGKLVNRIHCSAELRLGAKKRAI